MTGDSRWLASSLAKEAGSCQVCRRSKVDCSWLHKSGASSKASIAASPSELELVFDLCRRPTSASKFFFIGNVESFRKTATFMETAAFRSTSFRSLVTTGRTQSSCNSCVAPSRRMMMQKSCCRKPLTTSTCSHLLSDFSPALVPPSRRRRLFFEIQHFRVARDHVQRRRCVMPRSLQRLRLPLLLVLQGIKELSPVDHDHALTIAVEVTTFHACRRQLHRRPTHRLPPADRNQHLHRRQHHRHFIRVTQMMSSANPMRRRKKMAITILMLMMRRRTSLPPCHRPTTSWILPKLVNIQRNVKQRWRKK